MTHHIPLTPPDPIILLVEDNPINQDVLRRQLTTLGLAVHIANNGNEALRMLELHTVDLVITDCHMPVMNGFELTDRIRRLDSPLRSLPIIALTANAIQGEAERCRLAGMNDYITKPIDLKTLRSMLAKHLPDASRIAPAPDTPVPRAPATCPIDLQMLRRYAGDDFEFSLSVLKRFSASINTSISRMRRCASCGDCNHIAGEAHRLKSTARMVGASMLGDLFESVEEAAMANAMEDVNKGLARLTRQALVLEDFVTSNPASLEELFTCPPKPGPS